MVPSIANTNNSKWFQVLLTQIILNGSKYYYQVLTILFNINYLFAHS